MTCKGFKVGVALVALSGAVSMATSALSQEAGATTNSPPPRLVFNFLTGVNADSNRSLQIGAPDKAITLDTDLGLTYSSRTKFQSFDASIGALWRLGKRGETLPLEPRASLSYGYNNGGTRLSFNSRYSKSPVTLFEPIGLGNGAVSSTDVTAVTGSVMALDNSVDLQTGIQNPMGILVSAGTNQRHYYNNTDPTVFDNRTHSLSATLQLRPDRTSEFDVTRGYSKTHYDDALGTSQVQNQIGLGYQRELSPVLTLNAQYNHSHDVLGVRNTVEAGGTIVLPTGKLQILGGTSTRPGHGPQLVGQLSYTTTGPTDSISATLSRQTFLTVDNNDLAYARLEVDYTHRLNEISSVSFGVVASHSGSGLLGTASPTDYRSLSLTYTRQVTPVWSLRAGYLYRHLHESNSATSNAFFVTIGRDFVLLP
ncbi:hypothetical protein [Solirhodobacter olei]|uniref:hypothetical protein n=1 Tax=Solirhodobacter olei TaxID=2493082 RepID=UPI000FD86FDB|nr:hypothetical protein [Solirhodobacter olei]